MTGKNIIHQMDLPKNKNILDELHKYRSTTLGYWEYDFQQAFEKDFEERLLNLLNEEDVDER